MIFALMAAIVGWLPDRPMPDPIGWVLGWAGRAGRRVLEAVIGLLAMVHPTGLRNTQADDFGTSVDAGAGAGTLEIRTGTSIGAGTLLATITLNDPSFGSAAAGVATANGFPKSVTAAASGTIGHYVVKDSSGTTRGSGTSVGAGSGELNVVTLTVVSGQTITINSFTYTIPAGS